MRWPFAPFLVASFLGCRVTAPGPNEPALPALGGSSGTAPPDDDTPAEVGGRGGGSAASKAGGASTDRATGGDTAAPSRSSAEPSAGEAGAPGAASRADTGPAGAPGDGGTAPVVTVCDAQRVAFDEIRSGAVRKNVRVRLDAVATSQKFLLSHAHSGSCLFAAFLGDDPAPDSPRGVLVVSYGADAPDGEACAAGHDAIPDDLSPGDAVTAVGYVAPYAPSACSGTAPALQLMVDVGCSLSRAGRRVLPAPFVLSPDQANALATGTDTALLGRFGAGLVRLDHVSAVRPSDGTGSVAPYGVIHFAQTELELHNDLEYGDLSGTGPGDAAKSLVFPYPTTFSSVTGVVHLDYCTWSLTPRSRCTDLVPPSDNCP